MRSGVAELVQRQAVSPRLLAALEEQVPGISDYPTALTLALLFLCGAEEWLKAERRALVMSWCGRLVR
jgi:hypothetical protein